MRRTLAFAFAIALVAGGPVAAASYAHGPAASATRPHQKRPCGKAHRRGCWIEIDSFSFGVPRGTNATTHGATGREAGTPSVGEITVHKPKHKRP